MALVRRQVADVDLFIAVSEYYARFMRDYLRIPESKMRVATLGVNIKDLSVTTDPRRHAARRSVHDRLLRAHRSGEGPAQSRRRVSHPAARERACRRRGWSRPATCAPEHKPYLDGIAERLRAAGLGDEFVYRGTVDRAKKVQFFHDIDVLSVPSPYHEPKGLYLLEAMACGVPVVQPNHGAFPEIIERTGGGLLATIGIRRRRRRRAIRMCGRIRRAPRSWAARGAEGVRRHYTVTHMAENVLRIYQER